jgi:hypothetical protein
MRIHSFIKVCIAVLAIAFAVSMGTVPVGAQVPRPVSIENVTQVRIQCHGDFVWCGTYDQIAPLRWVQRRNDGKVFQFIYISISDRYLRISDDSRHVLVTFNFPVAMVTSYGTRGETEYGGVTGIYEISADNSLETCTQQTTAPGSKCTCDLGSLRPLQGAVGQEEVKDKKDKIVSGKKTRLDLAYDPIKIVRGPNGLLYVTDHHHGALAWLQAGHTMGTCQIQSDTISTDPTQFWVDLNKLKLVRLADKDGKSITEKQLPATLETLPDDPYRTLAWMVRKKDGFCRALMTGNAEFAEFKWADWFRKRPELPYDQVKASPENMRDTALRLAKSTAAAGMDLPGYRGDQPAKYKCGPDPD